MRRQTLSATGVNRDGYTNLPKTKDYPSNDVLTQIEEGLSYLYYSALKNGNGLKDPAKDKAEALKFLKVAVALLEIES